MVTVSPCDAPPGLRPCANIGWSSRSSRRRFRLRRTAILKSHVQTSAMKDALGIGFGRSVGMVNPVGAQPVPGASRTSLPGATYRPRTLRATQTSDVLLQPPASPASNEVIVVTDVERTVDLAMKTMIIASTDSVTRFINDMHPPLELDEHTQGPSGSPRFDIPDDLHVPGELALLDLEDFRMKACCCLGKLEEAAAFFNRNDFDSSADALESYWSLFVPEGIAEREAEHKAMEEDVMDLAVAYLGHLLLSDLDDFLARIRAGRSCMVDKLVELACRVPSVLLSSAPLSRQQFEEAYFSYSDDAHVWQEALPDALLLEFLSALQEHVKQVEYLTYL